MVSQWFDKPHGEMVMMYPQPDVYSKHVLVPYDDIGRRVGEALEDDPNLQRLARQHGFRTVSGATGGPGLWKQHGIDVPDMLDEVVNPPDYGFLDEMINDIAKMYPQAPSSEGR